VHVSLHNGAWGGEGGESDIVAVVSELAPVYAGRVRQASLRLFLFKLYSRDG
jgi:hypothetical protein